ncbi:MAG TPA: efflux RND transporter periplasmic adaptor subunit [Anaerolineales bacterium]|nr:efflux RND transporter periplasmic adaptor subunit [Anaerolineales bacterium]
MHPNPRIVVPIVGLIAVVGGAFWYLTLPTAAQSGVLTASGTIEGTSWAIAPELSGRVLSVTAAEGSPVSAGQTLVTFDDSSLAAQLDQAEAALAAAQANLALLEAGATDAQLAAAAAQVAQTRQAVIDANNALETLNEKADVARAQVEQELATARKALDKAERTLRNTNAPDIAFYEDQLEKAQDAYQTALENVELTDIGEVGNALQAARDTLEVWTNVMSDVNRELAKYPGADKVFSTQLGAFVKPADAQEKYDNAVEAVRAWELRYEQARRGTSQAVDDLAERVEDAQSNLDGALNPKDLDIQVAQAAVAVLAAQVADAEQRLADLNDGPDPDQLALAEARVETAEAQHAAAVATLADLEAGARQAQLDAARAQVAAASATVDLLRVQLAKLTLTAPGDGVVVTRAIEPGEMAVPGAVLLTLVDLDHLTVTVFVPEDRIGEVTLGEAVDLRIDTFADRTFAATVTRVADRAEYTPRNVQTVEGRKTTVFAVELAVTDADDVLKPGMPVDVTFAH